MDPTELLDRGRTAFGQHEWPDAFGLLRRADAAELLGPEDLERLATAAYLTGHDAESTATWTRAHQALSLIHI